jgi:predicted DNA-binding protein YlxM (UPF0122 family)
MPLSLTKLENLLSSKGFVATKFFVLDGTCFYIEVFAIKTADVFLLYIPSKYNFEVSDEHDNVYKIKYIEMSGTDNVTDEYAGKQEDFDVEDVYGNTNIELSPDKDHIEEHLESNYRRPISLKDISDEDIVMLKAIYRQMRRFKYCVQNLKYKLGIVYKNYVCSIRRDDSIDCFIIKHFPREDSRKLMIIVDLETFYDKNEKLIDDVRVVRESIYKMLERNQGMHTRVLNKISENRKDIALIPEQVEIKKRKYEAMMLQLENLLSTMISAEQKIIEELYKLDDEAQGGGIQSDISKAHHKARLDKELDKINGIKSDIAKNILFIREKRENKILSIDKISFDNTVMLDAMIKNFAKLKEFC